MILSKIDRYKLLEVADILLKNGKISGFTYQFLKHLTSDHTAPCMYCDLSPKDIDEVMRGTTSSSPKITAWCVCKGTGNCGECFDSDGLCLDCGRGDYPGVCQMCRPTSPLDSPAVCDFCLDSRSCDLCLGTGQCGGCKGTSKCQGCSAGST